MKTTLLVTLTLAMCQFLQAVDLTQSQGLTEIVTWNDLSSLEATGAGNNTYTLSPSGSYTQNGNSLTLSGGRLTLDLSAAGLDLTTGFTLRLDISGLNRTAGPFAYFTSHADYDYSGALAAGHDGHEHWVALANGSVSNASSSLGSWTAAPESFSGELFISMSKSDASTAKIQVYLADGTCLVDATTTSTLDADDSYDYLVLGGWSGNSTGGTHNLELHSMSVYSGLVPEPVTSSLGLVGLLALALRRRR